MTTADQRNRDRVRTITFYAALALGTYLLYVIAKPFLVPLCASAIIVVFFYPWHERLLRRHGRTLAAALSTVLVTVITIVPIVLVVTAFVREAGVAVSTLQAAIQEGRLDAIGRWLSRIQARAPFPGFDTADLLRQAAQWAAALVAGSAGSLITNVGVFLFDLVVVIFSMFFLFRDAPAIMATVRRILPFEPAYREEVLAQARDLVRASVVSATVVASAQGAAGGVLFWAVGIPAPVVWGVVMAFFSLLPVTGAWIVWLPAGLWLMLTGEIGKGLLLIGIGALVVSSIDNVLRPALLAGRSQLNGLLILISLIGGIGAFGLIGIVIGPVVMATMTSLLTAYTGPAAPAPNERGEPIPM
jgi:predicted PurR-regulated permease PerM